MKISIKVGNNTFDQRNGDTPRAALTSDAATEFALVGRGGNPTLFPVEDVLALSAQHTWAARSLQNQSSWEPKSTICSSTRKYAMFSYQKAGQLLKGPVTGLHATKHTAPNQTAEGTCAPKHCPYFTKTPIAKLPLNYGIADLWEVVTTYCLHKMGICPKGKNDETRSNGSK